MSKVGGNTLIISTNYEKTAFVTYSVRDGGVYQVALMQGMVLGDDGDDAERFAAYLTPEGFVIAQS